MLCIQDYIIRFLKINYRIGVTEYEVVGRVFDVISNGNGFVNFGLKLYNSQNEEIGTLPVNTEKTEFYKKALNDVYGAGCEDIDGSIYFTYTALVVYNDEVIGVLYATERGELSDIYYRHTDSETEHTTGINVCYIMNNAGKVIAYTGKGKLDYNWKIDEKQQVDTNSTEISRDDNFEMFIESANSKFGIVGDGINASTLKNWFSDYNPTYITNEDVDIELSNIWYRRGSISKVDKRGKRNDISGRIHFYL